ncbi:MAG: hypothetical protein CYPHOPRED_000657 [Cyphobasidiales sp. Tagirdzhanova-0007]|nr:MAG: hypothetical protein CYPHOPRED_000657 [Cyphobasidiales sp. Tagirdzhanova-0007]
MDAERIRWALKQTFIPWAALENEVDEAEDIISFLSSLCVQSGILLEVSDNSVSGEQAPEHTSLPIPTPAAGAARTLEELDAHPLTSLLSEHLVALLQVPAGEVSFVIDDLLDAYWLGPRGKAENSQDNVLEPGFCELAGYSPKLSARGALLGCAGPAIPPATAACLRAIWQ